MVENVNRCHQLRKVLAAVKIPQLRPREKTSKCSFLLITKVCKLLFRKWLYVHSTKHQYRLFIMLKLLLCITKRFSVVSLCLSVTVHCLMFLSLFPSRPFHSRCTPRPKTKLRVRPDGRPIISYVLYFFFFLPSSISIHISRQPIHVQKI